MAFQTEQDFLAGERAQINVTLHPFLTIRVSLEKFLVTDPNAECHAIAGWFRGAIITNGVSKDQLDRCYLW